MTEQCALCTDAEATTRIDAPHPLTNFVPAKLYGRGLTADDVVVPLCADCRTKIQATLDRYDLERWGGETAARADLQDFAAALDAGTVARASK